MKKILSILAIFLSLTLGLNAEVVTKTTTKSSSGEGSGLTREEAINNAIIEAIGKLNGVKITSAKESEIIANSDSSGTKIKDSYTEQIAKATNGRADTYEINSVEKDSDGKYLANVTIFKTSTSKKYKAPGLNASNRRNITVLAAATEHELMAKTLHQYIITNLTQSRKFNVLERDSEVFYNMEKELIKSGNTISDEVYKLGNVLATDYMLIFELKDATANSKKSNLTGKEKIRTEISIDYRVILFATRQVKYSNTIIVKADLKDLSMTEVEGSFNDAAKKITSDVLNAIYPLKVESMSNNEAIFSQTLSIGEVYECYTQGEVIKDSYTKETTGRVENKSGSVEIVRVNPKMSYAKVTEGSVKKGDICRPFGNSGRDLGYSVGKDANYQLIDGGGVNVGW